MMNLQITDYSTIIAFWLAFSRNLAVIMKLPFFEYLQVPPMLKALFTLLVTYAFFPYIANNIFNDMNYVGGANQFWLLTIFYTLSGLIIGYLMNVMINLFTASGNIITQQIGFAAVTYFDPSSGQQVGPFEKIIQWTLLVMIVSSGALTPMFKGMFLSFSSINLTDFGALGQVTPFFLKMFKSIFFSSLMLASPIIFTNMLVTSVLGIIARTVPQMNVLMVSFVINIGLGLLVFLASSEEFFTVAFRMYAEKLGEWFQFIS